MQPPLRHIIWKSINGERAIAPLITFRILFGLVMAGGALRFLVNGWVEKLYAKPSFFFKFYGFEWVPTPGTEVIYGLYALIALSALGIACGLFYRLSAVLFFLSFTWAELLDATNYLNHYYLIILLAFWLIWLPAGRAFSLDVRRGAVTPLSRVPAWTIHVLMFQIGLVYTFAGLNKLNPDWLWHAMPLAAWLPEHSDLPLIGYFLQFKETAYLFSWVGALYDISVVWFLLYHRTRPLAYLAVVVFHSLTALLFNIGLFPEIMITSTLIFFPAAAHRHWLGWLGYREGTQTGDGERNAFTRIGKALLPAFMIVQLLLPLRHLAYPGNVLWTEEGYRFSWRVMLVEKSGLATFTVEDPATGRRSEIVNGNYLTRFQEKQMAIQPDFILQFARFLADEYREKHGFQNPVVRVDAHVALNGRSSRPFIDPQVNLVSLRPGLAPADWILNPKP